jgi:deaminated glutathione amidase
VWNHFDPDDYAAMSRDAETLEGPASAFAAGIAKELDVDVLAGSIFEKREGGTTANTSVHFGSDGTQKAVYRKIHLYDASIPSQQAVESSVITPGEAVVTSQTAGGKLFSPSICYDLRFPELFRVAAVEGADFITMSSGFPFGTTRDHWEVLLRARAIENQLFVVASNHCGFHKSEWRSGGNSLIVDPWGVVIAKAGDEEQWLVADLNFDYQQSVREKLPALKNRRPAAYGSSLAEPAIVV